ncbi:MAG: SDR family NAD(P)-dependent oxidoreductase [Actinomycetota bacterium]
MSELQDTALQDRVVVITGAAKGQGAAEARACAKAGAQVVATDIDEGAVVSLAEEIGAIGLAHDVASAADWERVIAQVVDEHGRVDGLVNNAGIFSATGLLNGSVEETEAVWRVNQLGVYLGMRTTAPAMAAGGSIVNISSIGGLRGFPAFAYVASKFAVTGMTKSASRELAPRGIRVNSIHPGIIETDMLGQTDDARRAQLEASVPMGRVGTVDDVVGPVLFLLGPDSAYMTGAELTIDGGSIA